MKKLFLILIVVGMGKSALAGFPCSANECDYANGCIEGCSREQKTCSHNSVAQCVGKQLGDFCSEEVHSSTQVSFCWPGEYDTNNQCSCGS